LDGATRVAFDIGGTFTDVVLIDGKGRLVGRKVLSISEETGTRIRDLAAEYLPGQRPTYVHATTICSNAIIEGKTGRVALITTNGFRDVLEMQNHKRPQIYDAFWDRLPPLVPRALRFEVNERVLATGAVETALDVDQLEELLRAVASEKCEALAVCLINSYANPVHEEQIGELARQLIPNIPVSLSVTDFSEVREYERTSSVAVNAALMPVVDRYLSALEAQLDVGGGNLQIMQSSGGVMTSATARRLPARMIESGPAAGVLAARSLARELGMTDVLAFDMGGTTAKAALILGGNPVERRTTSVGGSLGSAGSVTFGTDGHVVRAPSIAVVEVGAGGGSLAWIDRGGALRVGPDGAGAEPGPACYGRGGTAPTVTDANVVLGYMSPSSIAGGAVSINASAARASIAGALSGPMGLTPEEAAFGVVQVADATMVRAIRAVTVERGVDPRTLTMIAFGGAGPLHAARLADALGIRRVCVPVVPGLFSAVGLLLSEYRQDAVRGMMLKLGEDTSSAVQDVFRELEKQVAESLRQAIGDREVTFHHEIDVQYETENAPLSVRLVTTDDDLKDAFERSHQVEFGYVRSDAAFITAVRVSATATAADIGFRSLVIGESTTASVRSPHGTRQMYLGPEAGWLTAGVASGRNGMARVKGPYVIEENDSSTLVPPGWVVSEVGTGALFLEVNE
jgi:N-methylhydantoinase A